MSNSLPKLRNLVETAVTCSIEYLERNRNVKLDKHRDHLTMENDHTITRLKAQVCMCVTCLMKLYEMYYSFNALILFVR